MIWVQKMCFKELIYQNLLNQGLIDSQKPSLFLKVKTMLMERINNELTGQFNIFLGKKFQRNRHFEGFKFRILGFLKYRVK